MAIPNSTVILPSRAIHLSMVIHHSIATRPNTASRPNKVILPSMAIRPNTATHPNKVIRNSNPTQPSNKRLCRRHQYKDRYRDQQPVRNAVPLSSLVGKLV